MEAGAGAPWHGVDPGTPWRCTHVHIPLRGVCTQIPLSPHPTVGFGARIPGSSSGLLMSLYVVVAQGSGGREPLTVASASPGSLVMQRWGSHDRWHRAELGVCGSMGAKGTGGCKDGGGWQGVACSGQVAPQEQVPCRKGGQASMKIGIPSPKRCARTAGGPVLECQPSRYNEGGDHLRVGTWFPARGEQLGDRDISHGSCHTSRVGPQQTWGPPP